MLAALEYGHEREAAFRPLPAVAVPAAVEAARGAPLLWIDAEDADADELGALATSLGWHPLVLHEALEAEPRQKADAYPGHRLVVLAVPDVVAPGRRLRRIVVVVGDAWIVTVHRGPLGLPAGLPQRVVGRGDLEANGGRAALVGILDAVADRYEEAADALDDAVDAQESSVLEEVQPDPFPTLHRASATRHEVAGVRRACGQLRETLGTIARAELADARPRPEMDLELRDVYDHVLRAHDDLDMLHDRMTTLAETRLAVVAYRQNEITKRLSAWAAVLAVPTITTGWFGQNFENLTGITWRYGELFALGLVALLAGILVLGFRRAGWL